MFLLILLLATLILFVYYVFVSHYRYWKKRGVPNPPVSYLFGNVGESLILKKNLGQIYDKIYNDYPSLRYVGFYKVRQPGIVLRDPEIIKEVVSKSISSFHANDIHVDEKIDPIITKNPFVLTGEKWKSSRGQLTPCFTSKQIKTMLPLMETASNNLVKHLEGTNTTCMDAKALSSKYTTDVVASCAFGLDANSFKDPNAEFRKMAELILSPSFFVAIKLILLFTIPSLAKILKIKFVPDTASDYFIGVISETIKFRKANNVVRGDFLDTMVEYKRKLGENVFSDLDVTGHTVSFLGDGIETSAIVLSYALYELGANLDVQEKLRHEVDSVLKKQGGVLDYDSIQEMTYLEQFSCENLRRHPAPFLGKICTHTFSFPSPFGEGPDITIEPNTVIVVPVQSLHHDPKYFPGPERFDPERFSEKNKERLINYTYLPFGEGPRTCVGQRFGTTQVKVALAKIVSNFEIRVNSKTKEPLEVDPTYLLPSAKGGIWLDFCKR